MDKQQSTQLKGIAILMMLWYHLFYREEVAELCTPLLFISDEPVARMVARACYPVSFFLILSGYGLSFLYRQGRLGLKSQLLRLLRLYIHYWVVLLIFVTIGFFVNPERYIIDPVHLAANITGLHCTYNGETWFLLPYAIICLLAVGFMPWLFRIDNWRKALLLVVGYAVCFGGIKVLLAQTDMERTLFIFLLQLVFVVTNLFYFALGVLLFRLISHYGPSLRILRKQWLAGALLLLLMVVKSQFKVTLADGLYAFLFIVLFLQLHVGRRTAKVLENIGRHSMPMWMTHTIYGFRYPVLIFIALVAVSYLSSFPILWLSKKVSSATIRQISSCYK